VQKSEKLTGTIEGPDGTRIRVREGYRGWMLTQNAVDQVVVIRPTNFTKLSLITERGYPEKFYWPRFGDFDGAKRLIDAVMAHDAVSIARLNAHFPEFNFHLGEWWERVKAAHAKASSIERRTLRCEPIGVGRTLRAELEVDRDNGTRTLRISVYRGNQRVASKVKAHGRIPSQPVETEQVQHG
jgi:hypothetical protein